MYDTHNFPILKNNVYKNNFMQFTCCNTLILFNHIIFLKFDTQPYKFFTQIRHLRNVL